MRFWIAAALLAGLVAAGLAFGPRVVDWNAYRPDIEAAAIELFGHDVQIGGPIEVALLPRPMVTARDVVVAGRTAEAIGFRLFANRADVSVDVGPLLAGRTVLRELRLRRPVLTIDAEGSRRLRAWPPRWQDWTRPIAALDLRTIGIAGGRIDLTGERPGRPTSLSDITLDLGKDGPAAAWEAAGLFKTERHRFTVSATFAQPDAGGASATRLSVEARNGVDETTVMRFSGQVTAFDEDDGVDGRFTLAGPDLQHGLAAVSAATGYPATFVSIAEGQPFAVEGRVEADRRGIRSRDVQVRLADKLGKGGVDLQLHPRTRLDLDAELPTLTLADRADLSKFLPLDLLSKLQVPPGDIDLRLRDVAYRGERARQAALRLRTGTDRVTVVEQAKVSLPGLIDVQYDGRLFPGEIGPRLEGRLAAVGDDLGSSLVWLGLIDGGDRRDGGWRGFSLESDLDISSVEIALSGIDLRLDSSRLEGDASLRFGGRKRLSVDVDVDRPNLDLYLDGLEAKAAAANLKARLTALDADIDTRFERLVWQGVHVAEGAIEANADQGRLRIDRVEAKTVGETAFSLAGDVDLGSNAAELNAELTSQHPIRALRHLKLEVPTSSGRLRPLMLNGRMAGSLDDFTLGIRATYDNGEAAIDGQAGWIDDRPRYDLRVSARHPDHQALASQFGLAPLVAAGDAEGPLELAGRLRNETGSAWVASGNAELGPTSFTGSLTSGTDGLNGPFEAKLSIGTPRRDSLGPFLIMSGLRLAGDWTPARWLGRLPTIGLRTAWLERVEGSLSLASKGGLVGEGLTMEASLMDGLLHVERLEASPWQGRLSAEATLERRRDRPSLSVAVDLDGIDAGAFADWLGIRRGVEGALDLDVEASTVGNTPYEMIAGLTGEMRVEAGPGRLEGLGIPALRRLLAPPDADGVAVDRSLALPFRDIDAEADLSRGILTIEDGRLVPSGPSDAPSADIDGTVDLLLWIADLALTPSVADTSENEDDPVRRYRVVGRPDRPTGFIADGNR